MELSRIQSQKTTERTPLLSDEELMYRQQEIEDRVEAIKYIESDVTAVNDIMRDISVLVSEQGTTLDRIEDNIIETHGTTERGVSELRQAKKYQSKSRRKLLCLLVMALIVFTILITIIVTTTKHKGKH